MPEPTTPDLAKLGRAEIVSRLLDDADFASCVVLFCTAEGQRVTDKALKLCSLAWQRGMIDGIKSEPPRPVSYPN